MHRRRQTPTGIHSFRLSSLAKPRLAFSKDLDRVCSLHETHNDSPKVVPASDDEIHVEQLVDVEQDARQVGHEEHADDADQDHAQLEVLGL